MEAKLSRLRPVDVPCDALITPADGTCVRHEDHGHGEDERKRGEGEGAEHDWTPVRQRVPARYETAVVT
jgi:hypothetical protein